MNCIPPNGDKVYKKGVFGYLWGRGNYQAYHPSEMITLPVFILY